MEAIKHWLNGGRNYDVGVQLYLQYGKDDVLRSLFKKEGQTLFKKDRLLQAMKDIWNDHKASFTALSEKRPSVPPFGGMTQSDDDNSDQFSEGIPPSGGTRGAWDNPNNDPVLSTLKEEWKKCFSEMKMLQHRLLDINNHAERCAAAHKILDLDDLCDEYYAKRDYYLQFGKLPEDKSPDLVGDPVKWPVKLANAKRYVREYKSKLKKQPDNVRFAAKVKHYQDEISFYEEKLKLHVN